LKALHSILERARRIGKSLQLGRRGSVRGAFTEPIACLATSKASQPTGQIERIDGGITPLGV